MLSRPAVIASVSEAISGKEAKWGNDMYKLKKGVQAFTVVDGEFAGQSFRPGVIYRRIPPREQRRFETAGVFSPAGKISQITETARKSRKGKRQRLGNKGE